MNEIDTSIFWDICRTMTHNMLINIILGGRGSGKSYGAKKKACENFLNKKEQFGYIRRYKDDLKKPLEQFFKDIAQIIGICLQLGMWATPILWNIETMSPNFQMLLSINPLVYVVSGYRDAIVSDRWFFERPLETLYFWVFTVLVLWAGTTMFKRLKPHFADVL